MVLCIVVVFVADFVSVAIVVGVVFCCHCIVIVVVTAVVVVCVAVCRYYCCCSIVIGLFKGLLSFEVVP